MPKLLRDNPIYLAPDIFAERDSSGNPKILDQRTGRTLSPFNVDDKIFIYERQVLDWFINIAEQLGPFENSIFVILMIAVSYIEGVEQYRNGYSSNNMSRDLFTKGLKRIFHAESITDYNATNLYRHLRCGLFRNGMTGDAIVLNQTFNHAIEFSEKGTIDINPNIFLERIKEDFKNYINALQDTGNIILRENFNQMFYNV